jgi:hypothetical protein
MYNDSTRKDRRKRNLLALGPTQTITPRHTLRYGQSSSFAAIMPFTHATESWGRTTMKKEDGRVMRKISRFLCGLMLGLSFGSVGARADVVLDWNALAVNTAVANNQSPFAQARYAAIVQLAVFEAVNSITHDYRPYLGTITAPADASPEAAAIEAAYLVLSTYFPASQSTLARFDTGRTSQNRRHLHR